MSVKGVKEPTKTFESIMDAARAYGANSATIEVAGQADKILAKAEGKQDLGLVNCTGSEQTVAHDLGVTPSIVIVQVAELPVVEGNDQPAAADYTAKSATNVKIKGTVDCKARVIVLA